MSKLIQVFKKRPILILLLAFSIIGLFMVNQLFGINGNGGGTIHVAPYASLKLPIDGDRYGYVSTTTSPNIYLNRGLFTQWRYEIPIKVVITDANANIYKYEIYIDDYKWKYATYSDSSATGSITIDTTFGIRVPSSERDSDPPVTRDFKIRVYVVDFSILRYDKTTTISLTLENKKAEDVFQISNTVSYDLVSPANNQEIYATHYDPFDGYRYHLDIILVAKSSISELAKVKLEISKYSIWGGWSWSTILDKTYSSEDQVVITAGWDGDKYSSREDGKSKIFKFRVTVVETDNRGIEEEFDVTVDFTGEVATGVVISGTEDVVLDSDDNPSSVYSGDLGKLGFDKGNGISGFEFSLLLTIGLLVLLRRRKQQKRSDLK